MMVINNLPLLIKSLNAMTSKGVLVGIPEDKSQRKDGEATNAMIGMVQEFGSAIKNIPPRPFLIPALKKKKDIVVAQLKHGAKNALHGEDIHITLEKVGLIGQSAVKSEITNGDFVALKESTIQARKRRRVSGKAGTKPLIDTGQLRDSITYVVRNA